jgi:catechol 2,3-dioxygenase
MEVKELGHVVLFVSDLARSRHFYEDILGWKVGADMSPRGVMFTTGRTHHELLLLAVGHDAQPIPAGRRVGMYHIGVKVGTTDDELREALETVLEHQVPIVGSADHTVTHSLYIQDPDGNEVELYIDVQPEVWRENPAAVATPTRPLYL